jgi:hypothetical protein
LNIGVHGRFTIGPLPLHWTSYMAIQLLNRELLTVSKRLSFCDKPQALTLYLSYWHESKIWFYVHVTYM